MKVVEDKVHAVVMAWSRAKIDEMLLAYLACLLIQKIIIQMCR
jgi:hypothetical protein